MPVSIKKPEDIKILREGGKRHAQIMRKLVKAVAPGVSTQDLEDLARKLIAEKGDEPALLNYKPYGAERPYPAALCVSVNDEVVHGIPNESPKVLREGDIVSIDFGLTHKGLITDMTQTVPVGTIGRDAAKLLRVTKNALAKGVEASVAGSTTGDIGEAIETYVMSYRLGIVRELAGHGVGYKVHEDPYVPNYGQAGEGDPLVPGMVLAIEPMVNLGTEEIVLDADGYTYRTADGSLSAHFEHTVLITEKGPEILTK